MVGHYRAGDAVPEWARRLGQGRPRPGRCLVGDGGGRPAGRVRRPGVPPPRAAAIPPRPLAVVRGLGALRDRRRAGVDDPGPLTPLDYWWLAGETESLAAAHALPVYPAGVGLLVPPEDGLIRVYSCMLKAALAEAVYFAAQGAAVRSSPLPCLGCLLGGAAQLLGRDVVKGALLDERWHIELAVCEEHGADLPAHFSIFDATRSTTRRLHRPGHRPALDPAPLGRG